METVDVYLWMQDEDFAVASSALRSLKKHLAATIGQWFVVGPRGEKLERLGYDLGARVINRPEGLGALGAVVAAHGESPQVIVWSSIAVLLTDWEPWQKGQPRLWPNCPATVLPRATLAQWSPELVSWDQVLELGAGQRQLLKDSQVRVLGFDDYEKALKGALWPFSPAVVILDKGSGR